MQATRGGVTRPTATSTTAAAAPKPPSALHRRGRLAPIVAAAARDDAAAANAPSPLSLPRSTLLRRVAPAAVLLSLLLPRVATPAARAQEDTTSSFPRTLQPEELTALRRALAAAAPKAKAPVLLRLVFHDAGTFDASAKDGGANASVRLELDRPENGGLKRGWRVIEAIRKELSSSAKNAAAASPLPLASLLSDADLIALAGAHAVVVTGGPQDLLARVRVGRKDTDSPDPVNRLPSEKAGPQELVAAFEKKTLSRDEMIALSGAHTLGSKGFGDPVTFDNAYYTTLLAKPWDDPKTQMPEMIGLPSDRLLPTDAACLPAIERYASDSAAFFTDFSAAYLKLTELGVVWR
jgi:L-ascorbate peroxidase